MSTEQVIHPFHQYGVVSLVKFCKRYQNPRFKDRVYLLTFLLSLAQSLQTPLHIAAEEGHKETCEVLVAKGAEVNMLDEVRSKFLQQDEG